jgi:MoaA/NifB/PqqE/SkfB family radical SAM enzyme
MLRKIRNIYYKSINEGLVQILKTPPYIILFASNTCPNKCLHCWFNDEWKTKNIRENILTFDEIEKISQKIKFIHFLTITGGEAFLRKEIAEIVKVFNTNTKLNRCDIPTSGFDSDHICNKVIKILKENKNLPFRVDVSIDGLADTHDFIRNHKGLFKEACKTIEKLRQIRNLFPNFDVSVITTISEYNNKEISELAEMIENILPDGEWMVNIQRPPSKNPVIAFENLKAYKKASQIIQKRINRKNYYGDKAHHLGKILTVKNSLRREIISEILQEHRTGGGCTAGSLIGVIFNDGEIRPCESLDISFGNIRNSDYDLSSVWNNPKAKIFRQEIQDNQCICTHECVWSTNTLIQPSCWAGMIKHALGN